MNRSDFQEIARTRVREARILLQSRQFAGAYYLVGYSVECALKACFAKQVKRYDFPDKELVNDVHTHRLEKLFRLSGLWVDFQREVVNNRQLEINWAVVKDWSETSRYDAVVSQAQAQDLYSACVSRQNGVLSWIRRRW